MKKARNAFGILSVISALFVSLFGGSMVDAVSTFGVVDAELKDISLGTTAEIVDISDGQITTNVAFGAVGDSITYALKVKNNSTSKILVNSVSDDNINPALQYEYNSTPNLEFDAGSEHVYNIKLIYATSVDSYDNHAQAVTVKFFFKYEIQEEDLDVPNTSNDESDTLGTPNTSGVAEISMVQISGKESNLSRIIGTAAIFVVAVVIAFICFKNKNKKIKTLGTTIAIIFAAAAAVSPAFVKADQDTLDLDFVTNLLFNNIHSIIYDGLGDGADNPNPDDFKNEDDDTTIDEPTRPGYAFDGWTCESENGTFTTGTTPVKNPVIPQDLTENVTCEAHWTANTYMIAFDGNGETSGTMNSLEATYDQEYALPTNTFVKTGNNFSGWDNNGETINDGTTVKNLTTVNGATVTLSAKWTPITYHVTIDTDGDGNPDIDQDVNYGDDIELPNNETDKEGYEPNGWTDGDGNHYDDGDPIGEITDEEGGSITITPDYTPITYIIAFDGNGATSGAMDSFVATYDVEYTLSTNTFAKTGHNFTGWNINGSHYADKAKVKNLTSVKGATATLVAEWTPITYHITIDTDGDGDPDIDQDVNYGDDINLPDNNAEKEGYTPDGWTDGDGNHHGNGDPIGEITDEDGDSITIIPNFVPNTYTVAFNGNGATSGSMESFTATYDQEYTLPANTFTRTGHNFGGWDIGSSHYADGGKIKNLTSVNGGTATLNAKWDPITFHITIDTDGDGDPDIDQDVDYDSDITLPNNENDKPGYEPNGWTDNNGNHYDDGDPIGDLTTEEDENISFTPDFTPISYTVAFNGNGATSGSMDSFTAIYDQEYTLPTNAFARTGFTFKDWTINGSHYVNSAKIKNLTTIKGSTATLDANWTPITFHITIDTDGDGDPDIDQDVDYDSDITLPNNENDKPGYEPNGWTDNNGNHYNDGDSIGDLTTEEGENISFTPDFTAKNYTIHFNANTDDTYTGAMADMNATYDVYLDLTANTFTRIEHKFVNWNTEADGSGTPYQDAEHTKNLSTGEDVTLYAQWVEKLAVFNTGSAFNAQIKTLAAGTDKTSEDADNIITGFKRYESTPSESTLENAIDVSSSDSNTAIYAWLDDNKVLNWWTETEHVFVNEDAGSMFTNLTALTSFDTTKFNTENTISMEKFLYRDSALTNIDFLNNLDTSNVQNMKMMVKKLTGVTGDVVFRFDTSNVTTMEDFASEMANVETVDFSHLNTSKVKNMLGLCFGMYKATSINLSGLDTSQNENFYYAFGQLHSITELDLSSFDTRKVKKMEFMFTLDKKLETIYVGDNFKTTAVNDRGNRMFEDASKLVGSAGSKLSTYWSQTNVAYARVDNLDNGQIGYFTKKGQRYVRYHGNTADNSIYETMTSEYLTNADNLKANAFVKEGYTFAGWATSADGEVVYSDGQSLAGVEMTKEPLELYAKWAPISYTVHFDGGENVTGSMDDQPMTFDVSANLTANAFEKEGNSFTKWSCSNNEEYENEASVINLTSTQGATITCTAQWAPNTYSITYNDATEAEIAQTTLPDSYVYSEDEQSFEGILANREGYTFGGWTGDTIQYEQDSIYIPAGQIGELTFTATWNANTYYVRFHPNFGADDYQDQPIVYDVLTTLNSNVFDRDGYSFTGWTTEANGSGASYTNMQEVSNLTGVQDGVFNLYAQWSKRTYQIEYSNLSAGEVESFGYPTSYDVDSLNISLANPTREGQVFEGWDVEGVGEYIMNLNYTIEPPYTQKLFIANWRYVRYYIDFESNGADGGEDMERQEFTYETEDNLAQNTYTRTGYNFSGWSCNNANYSDGGTIYNITTVDDDVITCTAQWTPYNYSIRFNKNSEAATGEMEDLPMSYDAAKSLTANSFELEDFTFMGWSSNNDGTGNAYADGESVNNLTTTENDVVNLYAIWERTCNGVCYDKNANDAEGEMSLQSAAANSSVILLPPNFSRDGYGFGGWNTKADGTGTTYAANQTITTPANGQLWLYAIWIEAQDGITMQNFGENRDLFISTNGTEIALEDERDGQVYSVVKIDGNWWMTENLRLDLSDENVSITSDNTNNPSQQFVNDINDNYKGNPDAVTWKECNSGAAECVNQVSFNLNNIDRNNPASYDSDELHSQWYSFGVGYNWYTATAGYGVRDYLTGDMEGDICPAGWHLPTGDEMVALASNLSENELRSKPYSFIRSGAPNGEENNGWNRGEGGYFWTSTATDWVRGKSLGFMNGVVYTNGSNGYYRFYGAAVRCVANESIGYYLTYNAGGDDPNPTVQNGYSSTGKYTFTIPDTIPTKTNADFLGWSREYGSHVPEYLPGDKITVTENSGLYGVWDVTQSGIHYMPNANDVVGEMNIMATTIGSTANLWGSNYSREGYGFAGWNTQSNGRGTSYGPNERITMNTDILRLYAQWVAPEADVTMQTFDKTSYQYSNKPTGTVIGLRDERDNQVYAVAKLVDGEWWTIENLRLNPASTSTIIDASNTNNPTQAFLDEVAASKGKTDEELWSTCNEYAECLNNIDKLSVGLGSINRNNTASFSNNQFNKSWYSYGVMYNFYTATAGNGTYSMTAEDAAGDICPSGWHLPKGGNDGEFVKLSIALGAPDNGGSTAINLNSSTTPTSTEMMNRIMQYPNNFVMSGRFEGTNVEGRYNTGNYWSASSGYQLYSYDLQYFSGGYKPNEYKFKYYGMAVRCIADDAKQYTINYDANGGTNAPSYPQTASDIKRFHTFTLSDIEPRRDHYNFIGWSTDPNATVAEAQPQGEYTAYNTTTTLYAVWEDSCPSNSICYDSNGGTGTMENTTGTAGQTVALDAPNFTVRPGSSFVSWNTAADGSGTNYGPNQEVDVPADGENLWLYANWSYTNGLGMQNYNCDNLANIGDTVTLRDNRDDQLYTVAKLADGKCWMTENLRLDLSNMKSLTTNDTDNPTSDFVSAASQKPAPTTGTWCADDSSACDDKISYDTSNLTGANEDSRRAYGVYYNYYTATAGKGTYSTESGEVKGSICPKGWHLPVGGGNGDTGVLSNSLGGPRDAYGAAVSADENTTPNGAALSNGFRSYPINATLSGAHGSGINSETQLLGSDHFIWTATVDNNNGAKLFNLDRWMTIPDIDGAKHDGYPVRCVANSTITWTLKFDSNGGNDDAPADKTATSKDRSYTFWLNSDKPTRTDHKFKGWSLNPNSTTVDYIASTNTKITIVNPTTTLYAVWELSCDDGYLCYDANGDDVVGTMDRQYTGSGYVYPVLEWPNYTREGYVFAGWNTNPNGTGREFSPGTDDNLMTPAYYPRVYAHWVPVTGTLQDFDCSSLASDGKTGLTDSRDGKTYLVTKLTGHASVDGKCWIAENLRLDLSTHGDQINSTNTNNPTSSFVTAANNKPASSENWCTTDDSACDDTIKFNNANNRSTSAEYNEYGVYYNWYTATAGNGTYATTDAVTGDICPKGWHIPDQTEYYYITYINDSTLGWNKYPRLLTRSGSYDGTDVLNRGTRGDYWMSTPRDNTTTWSQTYSFISGVGVGGWGAGYSAKNQGLTVRCISNI